MNSADLKALIEHVAGDAEAIAAKFGKPELKATIEKLVAIAEQPVVLEIAALALDKAITSFAAPAPAKS